MSTRQKKKANGKQEPSAKKQKVGIDMSRIPASLRNEGYTSGNEEEKTKLVVPSVIPDYLKCPVCKELFINPEMFACGHTVCKLCIERNICPVCKGIDVRAPVSNYILNQLIEGQYPEIKKQRQKELDEVVELRKKIDLYPISARYSALTKALTEFITERRVVSYKDIFEHLSTLTIPDVKSFPKENELKYFLSLKITDRAFIAAIGEHIVSITDVQTLLNWVEAKQPAPPKGKKKKHTQIEPLKMLPLLIACITRPAVMGMQATYDRLAKLYEIDIGKEIPFDEWKNQPSYWIKGIELGEITKLSMFEPFRCSCGMHHGNPVTDDEEFYSSDSDY